MYYEYSKIMDKQISLLIPYLLFQTLKMLPDFLHLPKFGVINDKIITPVTAKQMQPSKQLKNTK